MILFKTACVHFNKLMVIAAVLQVAAPNYFKDPEEKMIRNADREGYFLVNLKAAFRQFTERPKISIIYRERHY